MDYERDVMVNGDTGDIQIVGRTCEQVIRDTLSKYGPARTYPCMGKYTFPTTSATGVFSSEVFARFLDLMIERDPMGNIPDVPYWPIGGRE
jgi:hypothetical protein